MRILKRIIQAIMLLVIVAGIVILIILNSVEKRAIPDYSDDVLIENLQDEVSVIRDSLAVPHIYASSDEDLYRVVGYISAQDRLWQMDLMRRITTGRLSEIFGRDMINADQMFRSFEFSKKSREVLSRTDPEILKCINAYCDGVNQYIEEHSKKLSFEFTLLGYKPEPWTPVHSTNLIGYMAWDLTSGWNTDMTMFNLSQVVSDSLMMELFPDDDLHKSFVYPDYIREHPELVNNSLMNDAKNAVEQLGVQVFQGSNNWAVAGSKSETGMPILANDMHLGFMSPGIWYQMHHVVKDGVNVTGVVLPGQPYVIAGHNDHIAWGMTNITVDNIDFYLETINPADSNQYRLNGRWVDMRFVEETINIKDEEPIVRINRYTHRGPVISKFKGIGDKTISARWLGMDYSNELRSVHLFDRAENWSDFREAAKTFVSVSQNIVYADREGNIGLQAAGGLPKRAEGHMMVFPGDTTQHDWVGVVPFENMPYTFNPECGYVSSANNKTTDESYPHYIGTWYALPYRIKRIREMLTEKEKLGIEDFKKMQADQLSLFAKELTPVYLDALTGDYTGNAAEALKILKEWDYIMDAEKSAPLIFEQMYNQLIHSIYKDEAGTRLFNQVISNHIIASYHIAKIIETGRSGWLDDISTTGKKETLKDIIETTFLASVDTLSSIMGEDISAWKWGDVHTLTIEHPMGGVSLVAKLFEPNLGPFRVGGSFHTVSPYAYPVAPGNFKADHGASERHIFSTANWDDSKTVIPTGTSGVPASPYYGNQANMFIDMVYHDDPFTRTAVEKRMKFMAVYRSVEDQN